MRIHTRTVIDMSTGEVLEDEYYEYDGPVAHAGGGGGGDTTTTTVAEPPAWQTPYIKAALQEAQTQYQEPGPFYYPYSTVAPQNAVQQASQAGALNYASGGAAQVADTAKAAYNYGIKAADPLRNPFFAATADAIARPLQQTLTQQYLPQIDAGAVAAGQYGGARQGVAQNLALQTTQQAIGDQLSKFGSNAYNAGLNSLQQSLAQTPTVQNAGLVPSQIQGSVGDALQQYQQQLLQADIDRYNYYQQLPYQKLQQFAGIVGNPLGTSQVSTAPGQTESGGLTGALGGAALGVAANAIPIPGVFGTIGTAASIVPGGQFILPALAAAYGAGLL